MLNLILFHACCGLCAYEYISSFIAVASLVIFNSERCHTENNPYCLAVEHLSTIPGIFNSHLGHFSLCWIKLSNVENFIYLIFNNFEHNFTSGN